MTGTIVKGIAGFYYVWAEGNVYECRAKGLFRKKNLTPLVGDSVELQVNADGSGTVIQILPRLNFFDRPPVANVDTFVLVAAAADPQPSTLMLDRFLVSIENSKADTVMCFNKSDLDKDMLESLVNTYKNIYPIAVVSAKTGEGIDDLKKLINGKRAALAGPSGVGKSSITNLLVSDANAQTGEISERLLRGKNTTRHSELFAGDGFFLFDTPGFTSFDVQLENENDLGYLFPEFREYLGQCKFSDCRHMGDPDCAIEAAVESGKISKSRYESYKNIFKSIVDNKKY